MLAEQTARAGNIGDVAGERGQASWDQSQALRDELLGNYRGIYSSIGTGGTGGGGGGGYTPATFESSSLPFYQKLMQEGGYSDADKSNIESMAAAPISGLFEGLRRNLESAQAGRGLPSYSGGLSRIARDQAYQTSEASKGVAADLASKILESKLAGASGTTGIESEKRAFEAQERQRQQAARARAAAGEGEDYRRQLEVLGRIQGLMPDDLAYMDRQLAAGGLGLNTVTSRVNEVPMWQQALASAIPAAAGSAAAAFMPTGGGGNRNRSRSSSGVSSWLTPQPDDRSV